MICDYQRRPLAIEEMSDNVKRFNKAASQQGAITVNTSVFPHILSNLSQFVVIVLGGLSVVNDGIELGTFLALFSIFRINGSELARIYACIVRGEIPLHLFLKRDMFSELFVL